MILFVFRPMWKLKCNEVVLRFDRGLNIVIQNPKNANCIQDL